MDRPPPILPRREGKGCKDRVVPLGARAAAWLDRYLVEARPRLLGAASEALSVTDWSQKLTPRTRRADRQPGQGARRGGQAWRLHLLRHACATRMLEGGADVRHIQALLGHVSLSSTERHTQVAIAKLQEVHARTHPAARVSAEPTPSRSAPETDPHGPGRDDAAATG